LVKVEEWARPISITYSSTPLLKLSQGKR
jgi:hypothetical protein